MTSSKGPAQTDRNRGKYGSLHCQPTIDLRSLTCFIPNAAKLDSVNSEIRRRTVSDGHHPSNIWCSDATLSREAANNPASWLKQGQASRNVASWKHCMMKPSRKGTVAPWNRWLVHRRRCCFKRITRGRETSLVAANPNRDQWSSD